MVGEIRHAALVWIQAVCSRRPDLGHSVLYTGAIDRRRSALDDVATSAVVKHALKLDYGDFFCAPGARTKHSRRGYVQAGSRREAAEEVQAVAGGLTRYGYRREVGNKWEAFHD